jgi:hypothetical protein
MSITWDQWSTVSEGSTTLGAPVTAVPWGTRGRVAVFVADPNGGIYTTGGDPGGGWGPWASVSEGSTTPGGSVTAVRWEQGFALFIADPNGGIYTTGGDPQRGFGPWASVSEGSTRPGAPVTAVPWEQRVALFVADPNGGIYTTGGDPQRGFGPWARVQEGVTTPGAPVTALIPTVGAPITLFVTDPGGGIYTTSGDPQGGFHEPWSQVGDIRAQPGSLVTAHGQLSGFSLYVTDVDGRIVNTAGDASHGWLDWSEVRGVRVSPGTPVTAIERFLFVTDTNGIIVTNIEASGGPFSVVPGSQTIPGSPVSASQFSSRLDDGGADLTTFVLLMADSTGMIKSTKSSPAFLDDLGGVPLPP